MLAPRAHRMLFELELRAVLDACAQLSVHPCGLCGKREGDLKEPYRSVLAWPVEFSAPRQVLLTHLLQPDEGRRLLELCTIGKISTFTPKGAK